ncbi:short chain enoyl-CoA hydratase [Desulfacinum infernum DSM 9756]|jgi:enoyl-CoA hydratase/carnithine racemase|uniref:Short chain enoyl-CoA hydratase n=1 Tax=Desulfacinum infernum DSM 9756 TaxID=1121391 RepID=A0A1M4ZUT2_9BACT|nr:enoyl-CoA hydratase [Desulfacinum infernum]MBC7359812.1 enoyl-CoA hydratase [Desulfacinum sp.]MBZ4660317.1 enoyl-CoA hydratase [Desulfacinum sp.]SHF21788.1 short chain enoyl-CoA hydratase [Desulfacinum infernum DSM 9756]
MEQQVVLEERQGQVAILTLNRPEVMNSLNFAMLRGLHEKVESLRFDNDVRVIIITGAGPKAFCAGADLKERATLNDQQVKEFILTIRNLFTNIEYLPKPVIAAVNGIALGGGTELALACDIRIASTTATMGLTETRLAIIPGAGGTQRLPRLVGRGKAKELIFTGRRVGAEEALSIGLVNQVAEPEKLLDACLEMAGMICETGPIAIQQAKYAINYGLETDLHTGLAIESNAYWITIPTEDRLEGLAAFREKRKPVYKGK